MSIHDTIRRLQDSARAALARMWARHEAGEITKDEFLSLAVQFLDREIRRAEVLADLAVAAELTRLRGEIVSATGQVSEPDPERTRAALLGQETTQAHDADPGLSYGVAGAALSVAAYQRQTKNVMEIHGVTVMVRVANPGACEVCRDLEGQRLPTTSDPYYHKGCACVQRPVA